MEKFSELPIFSEYGIVAVNQQKPNKPLTKAEICTLSSKFTNLKALENKNGNILWVTPETLVLGHVKQIIRVYKHLGRRLHLNIGTHGSKDGTIVGPNTPQFADSIIIMEVLKCASEAKKIFSIHIVSSYSGPIYPDGVDIFHSWCYSEKYYTKNNIQNVYKSLIEKQPEPYLLDPSFYDSRYQRSISQYEKVDHQKFKNQTIIINLNDSTDIPTNNDSIKKISCKPKCKESQPEENSSKYQNRCSTTKSDSSQTKSESIPNKFIVAGNKFYDEKQYEKAIELYDIAISQDSDVALAYYQKGKALFKLGQYEEGSQNFEKSIQKDSTVVLAEKQKNIANLLLQIKSRNSYQL